MTISSDEELLGKFKEFSDDELHLLKLSLGSYLDYLNRMDCELLSDIMQDSRTETVMAVGAMKDVAEDLEITRRTGAPSSLVE